MYTKNPFIDDNEEDSSNQDSENDVNWPDLTENELKNAISLFNPNFFFYLFIKCIQPKVMTLNYFKIWFYFTNKSTLYNPTIYRQYCHVFTPC